MELEITSACSKEIAAMNPNTDLELGLSIGGGGGGGGGVKFLTAQDLPSVALNGHGHGRQVGTKRATLAVSQVVGWPPIRACRMNNVSTQTRLTNPNTRPKTPPEAEAEAEAVAVAVAVAVAQEQENEHLGFVKVNMDGVQIGRKLDLNAHSSYHSLSQTIQRMFFFNPCIYHPSKLKLNLLDGSSEFVLTYEDKEGDWMLVGDVPFRMFLATVKRLRIMRTTEANGGLAPTSQETNNK